MAASGRGRGLAIMSLRLRKHVPRGFGPSRERLIALPANSSAYARPTTLPITALASSGAASPVQAT
jgi:hypothetical protein